MLRNFNRAFEFSHQCNSDEVFCNVGSFGCLPQSIHEEKLKYDMEFDRCPELWFRRTSTEKWFQNRRAIAPYFSTNEKNLAFVSNTTSALNAILSSIHWKADDVILLTNHTFLSIRHACDDVPRRHKGVEIQTVTINYPIESEQQIVQAFASAVEAIIKQGKQPRLAIVDAISSMPAIRYPFEQITKTLQGMGVEVFIDAAHTPGQIDIDLDLLQADYFAATLHKWMFCPKGTSIIYVAPKHQATVRPPIVAFDFGKMAPAVFTDPLSAGFFWQGTQQNTSFACVTKALEFIENIGGLAAIKEHNTKLADEAEQLVLRKVMGSSPFLMPDMCVSPYMRNVFGPPSLRNRKPSDPDKVLWFYDEERVWTSPGAMNSGDIYFRLSCQISNTIDDYYKLADAVNHFASKSF